MLAAYISFNGNTEEAFNFYKTAVNGTITDLQRFGDAPHGSQMPGADLNKIMHIALEAPGGIHLMGNDYIDFSGEEFKPGNNFSLSLHPASKERADELFTGLSKDGTVTVPMSKAPWGDYFGMFTDKFGMKWMINFRSN
jgi:PhnB protein